jgi:C-terminal processing protease CtpA/Prc
MRKPFVALLAACVPSIPLQAQAAAPVSAEGKVSTAVPTAAPAKIPFVKADAEAAVRDLANAVEENYVFPDIGKKYAEFLRANLAAGKYASFPDADAFAKQVTQDLRTFHKDGHLRLEVIRPDADGKREMHGPPADSAVIRADWVAPGVAYISFRGFPGNDATLADVRSFLAKVKDAKTLILDVRDNGGGGLSEMNLIFAQIFAHPTTLVDMDIRTAVEEKYGSPFDPKDPLLRRIDGPPTINRREHFVVPAADQGALKDAKVYLLTSHRTFSAAEHFSLALKRTHRATLIGEATGGGAHFGGMAPMGTGYAAFIPVGRTFDPDNGQSWEGTGVQPNIVAADDKAIPEALKLAGVPATVKAPPLLHAK